jgi:hypothetical protein
MGPAEGGNDGVAEAWAEFADRLRVAGERVAELVANLDPIEQADGYRALLRATNNQLGRFEVDRDRPELVPFNGWREKFLMDNPDFLYWVADVHDRGRYRIVGAMGGARYLSITAYASSGVLDARANARIDSDALALGADGSFEVVLSREPVDGVTWLELPEGARSVWLRMFTDGPPEPGSTWCTIEPIDATPPPPVIEAQRFADHLRRAGTNLARWPGMARAAAAADLATTNSVRHWSEMTGGAAFTEPGIHYLRGSWELADGEALVIEGELPPCRYWNVLLYSRFLNSLDHRHRQVSRTPSTTSIVDGRYRYVLAAQDAGGDWLDTEGRPFGIFVLRFLHAITTPELPTVRRVPIGEVEASA